MLHYFLNHHIYNIYIYIYIYNYILIILNYKWRWNLHLVIDGQYNIHNNIQVTPLVNIFSILLQELAFLNCRYACLHIQYTLCQVSLFVFLRMQAYRCTLIFLVCPANSELLLIFPCTSVAISPCLAKECA